MYFKRRLAVKILAEKDTDGIIRAANIFRQKSIAYKAASQFLIDRNFPLHLYLELSRACSYKCPMCMRNASGSGGHLPERLAERIIREASKIGPTSYSLHLFGEPLANPKWHNVVEMIRSAHPHNAVLLTTNGFFMNEACCRRLIELKVNRIFVSLHSLNPEIYRRNTGGGELPSILNNIKTFVKMAGKAGRKRLFVRLFFGPNEPLEKNPMAKLKDLGVSLEIRGYHNFAGGKNEWTTYKPTVDRWPCFHPWFTLGVAVDGKVTVCCTDARLELVVGNAFEEPIEKMWKSEAVESIRMEHLDNEFKRWKTCALCDAWQFHPNIFFNRANKAR